MDIEIGPHSRHEKIPRPCGLACLTLTLRRLTKTMELREKSIMTNHKEIAAKTTLFSFLRMPLGRRNHKGIRIYLDVQELHINFIN